MQDNSLYPYNLNLTKKKIQDTYSNLPPIPKIPTSPTYSNNPQPSKSTNIIPVKGMINVENVENNIDDDNKYSRSPTSPIITTKDTKDYFSRSTAPLRNDSYNVS